MKAHTSTLCGPIFSLAWNPVRGCKYLTSISQALTSQYVSTWTDISVGTPQTERVVVLSNILALNKSLALLLSVISRQHRNNNRTIPVKDRLSQQFWQNQGCSFTCERVILEYDVLLKCVLLANIKRRCWTLQVVEWGDVLVNTNYVLQCLHSIAYKARYTACPEMQVNEIHALYDKDH